MFRTKLLRALFAIVLGGLVSSAAGCGEDSIGDTGSGKGPDMINTMESGRPIPAGASVMSGTTPPPGFVPEPAGATACRPDATCVSDFGCMGICVDNVITACQSCVDGVFTNCTERACQPSPGPSP